MEIITAGDGTAHVSSADDGTIYAGIAGNECYVTGVGDRLSCTMQGANTALVGTGVGIMYGRAFRVAMPEEVTIQSGTQSQRRNDVICAHFTTSSEGHESGELVVLKGTPTSGQEAEDPEIPSGDILEGATEAYMPLWRIPLDGINVGEPEAMFDVLMSMSELQGEIAEVRDSVSQNTDDIAALGQMTSVRQDQTWDDIDVTAYEIAGIVTVTVERWNQSGTATIFATPSVAGHIKAGHRPSRAYRQLLGTKNDGSWLYMEVDAAGAVKIGSLYAPGDSSTWGVFSGSLSYPVG